MYKKIILNLTFLFCLQRLVIAQNNNSPYSMYGIGDIEQSGFDRSSGMGHAGMALFSNRFLNNSNAASLANLDDYFFNFELATRLKLVTYTGNPISSASGQSSDMQIKKISIAMKIKPKWGLSIGLQPYSSSNYSFFDSKYLIGNNSTLPSYYEGSGSINQLYLAAGYKVSKSLSLGLQASYLFGQLNQTETLATGNGIDSSVITTRKAIIGAPLLKPSFQYTAKLNSKWKMFLGGTATFKTSLNPSYNLSVVYGNSTVSTNSDFKSQDIVLPAQYAGSIAARLKDKFTFAVDYSFQNWSDQNYKGISYQLINSRSLAFGFEVSDKRTFKDLSFERQFFQTGVFINNSYLQINGQQIGSYGATIGYGTNFLRSNLGLQISLEAGKRGTTNVGLIEEAYGQLNFIFSYRDFWFVKVKRFD